MTETNPGDNKEKEPLFKKIKEDPKFDKGRNFFSEYPYELVAGVLMFFGLVFSIFYMHLGGLLVGIAFGICFYDEIQNYFYKARTIYVAQGFFKTLMLIGTLVYFLITIPAFILGAALGFGILFLLRRTLKP